MATKKKKSRGTSTRKFPKDTWEVYRDPKTGKPYLDKNGKPVKVVVRVD